MQKFLRTWTGVVVTGLVVALLVGTGVVLAQQLFQREVPGTVTVESIGQITVTPTSLSWGVVNRDDVISENFTISNDSDGALTITVADNLTGFLVSDGTPSFLCSVNATAIEGVLAESANVTGNIVFTISHDALAGDQTFTLVIEGHTPIE